MSAAVRAAMPIAQGVAPCRHAGSRRRHLSWICHPALRALSEPPRERLRAKRSSSCAKSWNAREFRRGGHRPRYSRRDRRGARGGGATPGGEGTSADVRTRHAYSSTFSSLTVEVATGDDESRVISRKFPISTRRRSKALSVEEPAATSALLKAAQQGDQSVWLAFPTRDAHRAKLQRDRVSAERIAAEAELAVAETRRRRGRRCRGCCQGQG